MDYSFNLAEIVFDQSRVYYQGTEYTVSKINNITIQNTEFFEIQTYENNTFYFSEGVLHSVLDRPSVIWEDGTKMWFKKGLLHRDNEKPAIIWSYGVEDYFKEGKFIPEDQVKKLSLQKNIKNF